MTLDEALDLIEQGDEVPAGTMDFVRSEVERLRAEVDELRGHREKLAERCYRKDLELDELRPLHFSDGEV